MKVRARRRATSWSVALGPGASAAAGRRPARIRWSARGGGRRRRRRRAQGSHERAGGPHAEVRALDEAGARRAARRCTARWSRARIPAARARASERSSPPASAAWWRRSPDPNPLVAGRGFQFLREHGIEVDGRARRRRRALRLNRPFFTFITERRPFVIAQGGDAASTVASPAALGAADAADARRESHAARARHPRGGRCHRRGHRRRCWWTIRC